MKQLTHSLAPFPAALTPPAQSSSTASTLSDAALGAILQQRLGPGQRSAGIVVESSTPKEAALSRAAISATRAARTKIPLLKSAPSQRPHGTLPLLQRLPRGRRPGVVVSAFALTRKMMVFSVVLAASIAAFWVSTLSRKERTPPPARPSTAVGPPRK